MEYKENFLDNLSASHLNLTENEIYLAKYIKENYKKISFLDIFDVSKITDIEMKYIEGYINKLGFKDYEDFRNFIRNFSMAELKSTDRFEFSLINANPKITNIKNSVISKEIANLTKLMNDFDEISFYSIMDQIIKAPELIIIGTRSSSIIAEYAEQMFNKLGKKTTKFTSSATSNFDRFSLFDTSALVISIGFARYPKETIVLTNFFKKRNFKIVSLTDNTLSPLVPLSDISFTIPCESVSITDFYGTPISVINIIIILLSQIDKENSLNNLSKFEDISKDFGFYF